MDLAERSQLRPIDEGIEFDQEVVVEKQLLEEGKLR